MSIDGVGSSNQGSTTLGNPFLLRQNYNKYKHSHTEGQIKFEHVKTMYLYQLYNIAINRFRYIGLPDEIHPYALEDYLIRDGVALLAYDDMIKINDPDRPVSGGFVATRTRQDGELDVYGFYTERWGVAFGAYGYEKRFDKTNSILMRDKPILFPLLAELELYADRMATLWMTGDMNLIALRTPLFGIGMQDDMKDFENIFKDIYEWAKFIKTEENLMANGKLQLFNNNAPILFDKTTREIHQIKMEALSAMGVECNVVDKAERVQSAEVNAQAGATESYRNIGLAVRERSMEQFNRMNKKYNRYKKECRVEYNSDLPSIVNGFISDGSNIRTLQQAMNIDDNVSRETNTNNSNNTGGV